MSTSWVVSMTFVPEFSLKEKQLDALSDQLDEQDWSVAVDPDASVSVTAYIDDEPVMETAPLLVDIAIRALRDVGAPAEVVKVELMTEKRREVEAQHPPLPELLAATDVAKVLCVSRQRVSQLQRSHQEFPEPVAHTGAGSLWLRAAVDRFAKEWDRRPGRRGAPSNTSPATVVPLVARSATNGGVTGRSATNKGVASGSATSGAKHPRTGTAQRRIEA